MSLRIVALSTIAAGTMLVGLAGAAGAGPANPLPSLQTLAAEQTSIEPVQYGRHHRRCHWVKRCGPYRCHWVRRCW